MRSDRILIKDLLLRCIIGIRDEERRDKQDVVINIVMFASLGLPGRTDRIDDSVDYRAIKVRIVDEVQRSEYRLVEALAERIAGICLESEAIRQVRVKVEKPGALRFARSVGVEITRRRS